MRALLFITTILSLLAIGSAQAQEKPFEIVVLKSAQTMIIMEYGETLYEWPVSTGRQGKDTPSGTFAPQILSKNHKSSIYNNAPMPYSVFYSGNYAIHGGPYEKNLGRRASSGCVRVATDNARWIYEMVQYHGKENVEIRIVP